MPQLPRQIRSLTFQLVVPPEGCSNILEFEDENETVIMSISIDEKKTRMITIYSSDDGLSIPFDLIEKGLELAK